MNLYEVMGLKPDATTEDVRKAYRHLASKLHPDRAESAEEAEGLTARMAELNQANDILSNPERRKRYDTTGETDALPTEETQANTCAMNMLRMGIMTCARTGETDLLFLARQALTDKTNELNAMLEAFETQHARLVQAQGRLKPKPGIKEDLAGMVLQQALADLSERIISLKFARVIFGKTRKLLDQYERNPMEFQLGRAGGSTHFFQFTGD